MARSEWIAEAGGKSELTAYAPSWADRFTAWVARRPGPSWLYYLAIGLILFALQTALFWGEGIYPVGTLFPARAAHALLVTIAVWFLALLHYLDERAESALAILRPALHCSESEYRRLSFRLTTMPARTALLASLIGGGFVVLSNEFLGRPSSFEEIVASPLSAAFVYCLYILTWWVAGAFMYHTYHQLKMINLIYTNHTRVDIFRVQPLYAFSSVTALTAVSITVAAYLWVAANPGMFSDPVALVIVLALTGLALASFVWPLLGIHRLLVEEKGRLLDEAASRFEATLVDLHQRVDSGQLEGMDDLHKAIASLEIEQRTLDVVPAWPWRPETMRLLITALALPLALWVVQLALQGFLQR